MKICIKCEEVKLVEEFYRDKSRKDGRNPYCKVCRSLEEDRRTPEDHKILRLKVRYGLTLEEYQTMLKKQNNKCAICGIHQDDSYDEFKRGFHVDHDHETGTVRALLCSSCNRGIGFMGDDPVVVQKADDYLKYHNQLKKENRYR